MNSKKFTRWSQLITAAKAKGFYVQEKPGSTFVKHSPHNLAGIRRTENGEIVRLGVNTKLAPRMTLDEAAKHLGLGGKND